MCELKKKQFFIKKNIWPAKFGLMQIYTTPFRSTLELQIK